MIIDSEIKYSLTLSCPEVTLVFLHAFPLNFRMWDPQTKFLDSENIGYVAFDYPGFGNCPQKGKFRTMADLSRYTRKLLYELNINRTVFIGLSMGGYLALRLLKDYPEMCSGIILANSRATADNAATLEKRQKTIENLKQNSDIQPVIDSHLELFADEEIRSSRPELIRKYESLMKQATVHGIISAQQAMASRKDSTVTLMKSEIPVLLLAGSEDQIVPIAEYRELDSKLPNARLEVIENAGHISNLEQPDMFNQIILQFLSEVRGKAK